MDEQRKTRLPAQPGNALLLAIFAGFTLWYIYDAWSASPSAANLILIAPIGILTLLCIAVAIFLEVKKRLRSDVGGNTLERVSPKTLALMTALALYVGLMPYIGFDIATLVFSATGAYAMGERRPHVLAAFAILLTAIAVVSFKYAQPVPLPLTLSIWP